MKTIYINGENNGAIGANTYVYYDEHTLVGVIIDPGAEPHKIINTINTKNIDIRHILLTHGHFDHIATVPHIKQNYNADICVLKEENIILSNPLFNASILFGNPMKLTADKFLNDGDEINVGNGTLKVIHTPGHTVGGACYYDEKNNVIFTGDTLFHESIGRTDLYGGDSHKIITSIKQKLFILPEDITVYCGHGDQTTIGHEKKHNPFLK